MYEYIHGGNAVFEPGGQNFLDLSANINPLGVPNGVDEAVKNQISFVTRYPDSISRQLRKEIAAWERVEPEWIFCGNGASDIIFRLPVCIKPETVLLPAPTFSDYERAAKAFGAKIERWILREEQGFCLDSGIIHPIDKCGADIVFICNPNNPTGILTKREELDKIVSFCEARNTFVVVDECFIDFTEEAADYTVKPLLNKHKNLIILKAFTKIFALPGIRLGYAISGNRYIVDKLYENGADWTVSNFAQAAGEAAAKEAANSEYLSKTVSYVADERNFMKRELDKMGYVTFDSRANYLFFKNPYNINLIESLKKFDIIIRDCGNYTGLSADYCRVAVSTRNNNQKFIDAIRKIR